MEVMSAVHSTGLSSDLPSATIVPGFGRPVQIFTFSVGYFKRFATFGLSGKSATGISLAWDESTNSSGNRQRDFLVQGISTIESMESSCIDLRYEFQTSPVFWMENWMMK